jgi:uncharacterized protein (TIGR02145 family)
MKKRMILKASSILIICCILTFSCKKETIQPENQQNDMLLKADPIGNDRPLPYSYPDWMKYIDGEKYLSEITIPGTHDSGADLHTSAQGAESDITIAQDFRIANQLMLGVRWFDIRLNDDDGTMTVFHGPYYLHKNFNDLIRPTLDFLTAHPTEVVVFMIKQEHSSRGDDAFANGVLGYLNWSYPDRFWMGDHIPKLSEVRGKVVIVRKFWGTHGYPMGMPLIWNDNTSGSFGSTDDPNLYVYVQDHYKTNTVTWQTKCGEIESTIEKAHNEPYPYRCYYLNFTSCESDVAGYSLKSLASNINPRINNYLLSKPTWHNCGVIFVNFAGGSDDGTVPNDLVRTILNMNEFELYPTITIGTQKWMLHNLDVTKYRNGDPIPNVTDNTAWSNLSSGAYCNYDNNAANVAAYGRLYNWAALNDPRGLAPAGYHIASVAEWNTLINYLGGGDIAGGKLKEAGTSHWSSPNSFASNSSGFTATGAGYRHDNGDFDFLGISINWWTPLQDGSGNAYNFYLNYISSDIFNQYSGKKSGYSVRCIKD